MLGITLTMTQTQHVGSKRQGYSESPGHDATSKQAQTQSYLPAQEKLAEAPAKGARAMSFSTLVDRERGKDQYIYLVNLLEQE